MDTHLVSLYEGKTWHVVALEMSGRNPTQEYFDHAHRRNSADVEALLRRMEMVADQEKFSNKEVFRHEKDGIWVFKTRRGLRLYCFRDENFLIVTVNGADKPKKKQQQKDIAAAAGWRQRYLEAKTQRTIPIIHETNQGE